MSNAGVASVPLCTLTLTGQRELESGCLHKSVVSSSPSTPQQSFHTHSPDCGPKFWVGIRSSSVTADQMSASGFQL